MNNLSIQVFKYRLNIMAFVCFFLAISAVQISYLFDGIEFLDLGILLLIPSFLFFIIWLLQEWTSESKDYCVGLTLLTSAVIITLIFKYKFQVGTIDDSYHTFTTISYSVKNSIFSKFQVLGHEDIRFSVIDFIENIWGIAWRFIHWDYIIVLIQILPVFILWRQLVEFFRNRKIDQASGFLSTIIILSMQIIWAQACSTFVDSLTGILAALTLLRIADLLACSQSRNFYNVMTAAFLSTLCLLPKPSLVLLSVFGLSVSLWFALKRLTKKESFITVVTLFPSSGYCIKHYYFVWAHGLSSFLSRGITLNGSAFGMGAHGMVGNYYRGKHFFNFKPLYVFSSWLYDYRLGFVTPSPTTDVGNGLLWTYLVVPILVIALVVSITKIRQIKGFHASVLLLIFLVLYYYFMDVSVVARFMIGFNIFIMAWAFAWILGSIKKIGWRIPLWFNMTAGCLVLVLALLSFFQAIKGALLQYRVVSVLEAQRQLFPRYIDALSFQKRYCTMLVKDYKGKLVSDNVQFLINECEVERYKQPPKTDRKIPLQDYQFSDVSKNYENLKFMTYNRKDMFL